MENTTELNTDATEPTESGVSSSRDQTVEMAERLKAGTREQVERAREMGRTQAEQSKDEAAAQTRRVAGAVERAAAELDNQGEHGLARYADDLAAGMDRLADRLRSSSIDDLMREAQNLARRNPTLFLLGSVGVGFAISRFLKASPPREGTQASEPGELATEYQSAMAMNEAAAPTTPETSPGPYAGTVGEGSPPERF